MAGERDELLTINQVSAMLELPVQSIYKQRQLGKFCPAYRVGKRLLWRRSELMAWLETKEGSSLDGE
jgi:predicted DNA-binding transcriptional regulator AlpA